MKIQQNVGGIDRILRAGAGSAMLYVGFVDKVIITDQFSAYLLGLFGLIIFLSGVLGSCPMYNLVGFNSCGEKKEDS